ncbi:hypothetical protein DL886_24800 [Salmonella enterica subsp. enterica serovar Infantis]|uniref:Uncharacterized protein n=2 Tax=Salmonella enterica TaxID=28901 RepID=A0A5T3Q2B6_SALER|nr:hypothetical protein [Salmonella enterica]EAA2742005.1 hypothetical protein [Salmonella enterica subsp. enterica serovar Infantis]EAA9905338.1 hypothetical protein [Salmonella enterica subsp. enterica]EBY6154278.1 hypothetical protein [Salmonella enterica subsp. enterica serovar Enteritidis]ECB2621837.1 hypothetical protein [Salmonella enterica subsp. enterica serovar Schwarzengrund]
MLGGADNSNSELLSYISGAKNERVCVENQCGYWLPRSCNVPVVICDASKKRCPVRKSVKVILSPCFQCVVLS